MMYLSLALGFLGALAWDGWRRYLQGRIDAHKTALEAMELADNLREDMNEVLTKVTADIVAIAEQVENLETKDMLS